MPEEQARPGWTVDPGWRCLKVQGPLNFSETGIIASIAEPLSALAIPLFALSTYDTDYFLVREGSLNDVIKTLETTGHTIS